MWHEDRIDTEERYRNRWREYGYDLRTLGWNKDCQWVRFEAALEGLGEEEFGSVLDIGCGFGDLLSFLRVRGWRGRYVGIDLVPELIEEAVVRHGGDENARFMCDDEENLSLSEPCDLVVAIGIFNHKLKQGNLDYIRLMLTRMLNLSRHIVVCDFLSSSSDCERRKDNLYYADPKDIFSMAARHSRRVILHHGYMPFEFQIKIWRDDSFESARPVFSPYADLAYRRTRKRHWRHLPDAI